MTAPRARKPEFPSMPMLDALFAPKRKKSRARKPAKIGRSTIAHPKALRQALVVGSVPPTRSRQVSGPASELPCWPLESRKVVPQGIRVVATTTRPDAVRVSQQPIPPTLRRLERAAMKWWKSDGFEYVIASQNLRLAVTAHAAWKAKQRRTKS